MKEIIKNAYKSFVGETEYLLGQPFATKSDILVLAMHSTPLSCKVRFENLIEWMLKHYSPISPSQLSEVMEKPELYKQGPYVLFTFDDGLKNNLQTARYLSSKGIHAVYFVVPEFIDATNSEEYYLKNIRPFPDRRVDCTNADVTAMSWEEVNELLKLGHTIGSHTMTHRLHAEMKEKEIRTEIIQCKIFLEEKLGVSIEHFASPNNTLWSTNRFAAEVIQENHKFHHTTVPGIFDASLLKKGAIYRRNIECHWSSGRIKFALGYADLRRWQKLRDALSHLVP